MNKYSTEQLLVYCAYLIYQINSNKQRIQAEVISGLMNAFSQDEKFSVKDFVYPAEVVGGLNIIQEFLDDYLQTIFYEEVYFEDKIEELDGTQIIPFTYVENIYGKDIKLTLNLICEDKIPVDINYSIDWK